MIQLWMCFHPQGLLQSSLPSLPICSEPLLEARLQQDLSARIESLRAAYVSEHEYLKELIKRNYDL